MTFKSALIYSLYTKYNVKKNIQFYQGKARIKIHNEIKHRIELEGVKGYPDAFCHSYVAYVEYIHCFNLNWISQSSALQYFLTEMAKQLKSLKQYHYVSQQLKETLVQMVFQQQFSIYSAAQILQIKHSTAKAIIRRYKSNGYQLNKEKVKRTQLKNINNLKPEIVSQKVNPILQIKPAKKQIKSLLGQQKALSYENQSCEAEQQKNIFGNIGIVQLYYPTYFFIDNPNIYGNPSFLFKTG